MKIEPTFKRLFPDAERERGGQAQRGTEIRIEEERQKRKKGHMEKRKRGIDQDNFQRGGQTDI